MNTNLLHNLSYSINLPKATVHSQDVMLAVNKTLTKYYFESHYQDYKTFYNLHKNLFGIQKYSATMQSEKMILCEINACLWVKALNSTISNITKYTYPHYIILQQFVNYLLKHIYLKECLVFFLIDDPKIQSVEKLLMAASQKESIYKNANSDENFGLLQEFFWKLLVTHPPKSEMHDYYWQIMSDYFLTLNDKKIEEQTLLFCLIEEITSELKITMTLDGNDDSESDFSAVTKDNYNKVSSHRKSSKSTENFNNISDELHEKKLIEKQIYFTELPWNEKIKRCLIALNFVYDILETDFTFWLHSKKFKPSFNDSRPLMIRLLWQNTRDTGLINKEVHKILDLYEIYLQSDTLGLRNVNVIEKLVILLGEIIRCNDSIEDIKYPFAGIKCFNFFRELSLIFYQRIVKVKKIPRESELIVNLKPPWLRLFLCCHLLSSITGYQCRCELTGVYDILEHIAHTEHKSQNVTKTLLRPNRAINSRVMGKLKKLKSINAKLKNGKTQLHLACEEDDIEKIRALFTFPELDVNAVDRDGWTALHTAAFKGNTASIQELLSFCPESGDAQKSVNTRARGPESITPLMCAVSEGHAKVCQMLLEHAGSVLLEDVNELNLTPLELSNLPEVMEVLQYYKNNNVWTLHSHSAINFDMDLKGVVIRLCVEMIHAYFCTYRTWDVYKTLKRSEKNLKENLTPDDENCKWDYMRYHRDIKRNIYKLRRLATKLEHVKEFEGISDIYVRILSFNKMC